ncbi:hypothetical protein M3Y97_00908100 [Aphelenchoides bicaudatus]|nr:hypothetical protein M3Y97_00908100 [Aphelenchoides bicaudatus]
MATPYLLSCSAIFALVGLALIGIAGFTDNWAEYSVNSKDLVGKLKPKDQNDIIYYSRNYGLFLICFPENVPSGVGSFTKLGSPCLFSRDFFPEEAAKARYNTVQTQRMYFMRGMVATYFAGFALGLISLIVGAIGCFKPSARMTLCTGFMLLFAVLLLAVSMGLWHFNQYAERRLLNVHPFPQSWDAALKQNTHYTYGYSYVLAWIGVCFTLLAAFCLIIAHLSIKRKKDNIYDTKHAAYYQQYYEKSLVPYTAGYYGYDTPQNYYGHYPTMTPNYYGHYPMYGHH